jgi:hypothetical protein
VQSGGISEHVTQPFARQKYRDVTATAPQQANRLIEIDRKNAPVEGRALALCRTRQQAAGRSFEKHVKDDAARVVP